MLILDDNDKVSFGSRAICFAKRPLEILDRLGCGQPMVDKGVVWNLGEENTQTPQQQRAMAAYIREVDPYDHHIVVHTYPGDQEKVYSQLDLLCHRR